MSVVYYVWVALKVRRLSPQQTACAIDRCRCCCAACDALVEYCCCKVSIRGVLVRDAAPHRSVIMLDLVLLCNDRKSIPVKSMRLRYICLNFNKKKGGATVRVHAIQTLLCVAHVQVMTKTRCACRDRPCLKLSSSVVHSTSDSMLYACRDITVEGEKK